MSNLPPLPESEGYVHYPARDYEPEWTSSAEAYTADQLRSFAEEAVRLEREAILKMLDDNWYDSQNQISDAIRARSQEGQG